MTFPSSLCKDCHSCHFPSHRELLSFKDLKAKNQTPSYPRCGTLEVHQMLLAAHLLWGVHQIWLIWGLEYIAQFKPTHFGFNGQGRLPFFPMSSFPGQGLDSKEGARPAPRFKRRFQEPLLLVNIIPYTFIQLPNSMPTFQAQIHPARCWSYVKC